MVNPRLTDCPECSEIPYLLNEIDCKLKELALSLYNNVIYSLNKPIAKEAMGDLITYKRILTYKNCNHNYAKEFTVNQIASRVKILTFK